MTFEEKQNEIAKKLKAFKLKLEREISVEPKIRTSSHGDLILTTLDGHEKHLLFKSAEPMYDSTCFKVMADQDLLGIMDGYGETIISCEFDSIMDIDPENSYLRGVLGFKEDKVYHLNLEEGKAIFVGETPLEKLIFKLSNKTNERILLQYSDDGYFEHATDDIEDVIQLLREENTELKERLSLCKCS